MEQKRNSINLLESKGQPIQYSGNLRKWINIRYQWKDLYFILEKGILAYYTNENGQKLGSINLEIATIIQIPDDPLRIIINSGTKEVHLRAFTINEKIKWVKVLKLAQEEALQDKNIMNNYEFTIKNDKDLPVDIKELFLDTNLPNIYDNIAKIWNNQANINEACSMLEENEKNKDTIEFIKQIENVGNSLKVFLKCF